MASLTQPSKLSQVASKATFTSTGTWREATELDNDEREATRVNLAATQQTHVNPRAKPEARKLQTQLWKKPGQSSTKAKKNWKANAQLNPTSPTPSLNGTSKRNLRQAEASSCASCTTSRPPSSTLTRPHPTMTPSSKPFIPSTGQQSGCLVTLGPATVSTLL